MDLSVWVWSRCCSRGAWGSTGNHPQSWQYPNRKVCEYIDIWGKCCLKCLLIGSLKRFKKANQMASKCRGEARNSQDWRSLPISAFCYCSAYLITQLFIQFPTCFFYWTQRTKARWHYRCWLDSHWVWGRKLDQSFSPWVLCLIMLIHDVWLPTHWIHSNAHLVRTFHQ